MGPRVDGAGTAATLPKLGDAARDVVAAQLNPSVLLRCCVYSSSSLKRENLIMPTSKRKGDGLK